MKALSLWQPFPSLTADGVKTSETLTWPAPTSLYGQRVGIHAAKRWLAPEDWSPNVVIATAAMLDVDVDTPPEEMARMLPYGAMVATATLVHCRQVVEHDTMALPPGRKQAALTVPIAVLDAGAGARQAVLLDGLGDYSIGRWVWRWGGIERLDPPVPARGAQGLWEWSG